MREKKNNIYIQEKSMIDMCTYSLLIIVIIIVITIRVNIIIINVNLLKIDKMQLVSTYDNLKDCRDSCERKLVENIQVLPTSYNDNNTGK